MRQNDVFEQMRIIARQLTPDEMHAVAAFYGAPAGPPGGGGIASRQLPRQTSQAMHRDVIFAPGLSLLWHVGIFDVEELRGRRSP